MSANNNITEQQCTCAQLEKKKQILANTMTQRLQDLVATGEWGLPRKSNFELVVSNILLRRNGTSHGIYANHCHKCSLQRTLSQIGRERMSEGKLRIRNDLSVLLITLKIVKMMIWGWDDDKDEDRGRNGAETWWLSEHEEINDLAYDNNIDNNLFYINELTYGWNSCVFPTNCKGSCSILSRSWDLWYISPVQIVP